MNVASSGIVLEGARIHWPAGWRQVLVGLNMQLVTEVDVMIGNATQRFDEDGRLIDEPTRHSIARLLEALVHLIKRGQDAVKQVA